jgi:hypothetical protein
MAGCAMRDGTRALGRGHADRLPLVAQALIAVGRSMSAPLTRSRPNSILPWPRGTRQPA